MLPHHFRPATNADADDLRTLIFGALAEYGLRPDPGGTDRDLDDLEAGYGARGGCFEALVVDDELAGCYGLYPLRPGVCELRKMYLRAAWRGQGLGRATLDRALERARALGFARVELETASVLVEALALYRRAGFVPFAPDHLAARCDQALYLDLPPTS